MDYKEKYKQAVEKARIWKDKSGMPKDKQGILDDIFPELKESEDESIIRDIRVVLESSATRIFKKNGQMPVWYDRAVAWLEKQGKKKSIDDLTQQEAMDIAVAKYFEQSEQKPADKVEPKFHEGDWISGYYTNYKVLSVNDNGYVVEDVDGNKINILFENEKFHSLWNIKNAKDGDVLYSPCCKLLWIYKDEKTCHVGSNLNYNSGSIVINKPICIPTDVQPATKKQREQLEKAMADVIAETQKEWSEDDESNFQNIDSLLFHDKNLPEDTCMRLRNWIESLKDRVQPQQEWSEEDEKNINELIRLMEQLRNKYISESHCYPSWGKLVNWLKSLRPCSQWKPSEGQLECLGYAIEKAEKDWSPLTNNRIYLTLKALKEQLEKNYSYG